MITVGVLLFVAAVILVLIAFTVERKHNVLATVCEVIALLFYVSGILFCALSPRDNRYVIECSDCKVIEQTQMTITDGDTVINKKYIIKYKK